jgi:hypothetical protein
MSSIKVSALTAKTSPSGSEELLINDSGTSKKITIANLPDTDTVYTHPNHSGDVVSSADGATTIQAGAVDIAMLSATGTAGATTFLRGDNVWEAVSGASLSAGDTFDNPNNISTNQTNTLVATKNYMLIGEITVSGTATWTVDGTGELRII